MTDEMSGRQLAEVLRFLTRRVQDILDEGQDVVKELRTVVTNLEDKAQ